MTEAGDQHDAIRRLIDSLLLKSTFSDLPSFFSAVHSACQRGNIVYDFRVALEYWWHLARLGVVAVPGESLGSFIGPWRTRETIFLTDHGRRLLERGEESPHDPRKYLDGVKRRVPNADDIALAYLNEAVGAWSHGLNRASAVMLGCACERLVLLLAEAVASLGSPDANKVKKALEGIPVRISSLFDSLRVALFAIKDKLSGELRDAIDRKLSAVFDHARGLRNQSGHPTGEDVSSDDAEAGLLLFPGFCLFVHTLIDDLKKLVPASP